jgi:mannose-6-phosphate isomerase-like protein (cupin superfamily)
MKGYTINLRQETNLNTDYRRVLYTAKNSQLVLMCVEAGQEIGAETHDLDQFIYVISGNGNVVIDQHLHQISEGFGIIIPAGSKHNVINTGDKELKIYTIYTPPEHIDGTTHETKEIADSSHEEFDGVTTE